MCPGIAQDGHPIFNVSVGGSTTAFGAMNDLCLMFLWCFCGVFLGIQLITILLVPGSLLFRMSQEHVGLVQADGLVIQEEPLV